MEFPSISNIKQVVETDISWAGKNSTGKDQLSIITANDFASIQQFSESGDLDYQPVSYTHLDVYKRQDIYCHSDGVYIYVLCFSFHFQQLL